MSKPIICIMEGVRNEERWGLCLKAKKLITVLAAVATVGVLFPVGAFAESLDALKEKEDAVTAQSNQISGEVQATLNDVNDKYAQMEKTKQQIAENEEALAKTQKEIKQAEANIEKRKDVVAERMKEVQLSGGMERDVTALLDAESISDFVNRAYAMSLLQSLENEKINSLGKEKARLQELQEKVKNTQGELEKDQAALEADTSELTEKIAGLKEQLASNQKALAQIAESKEVEESRIAAEKARKEEEAKKQAEAEAATKKQAAEAAKAEAAVNQQPAQSSSTTSNSNTSSSTPVPAEKPSAPSSNSGGNWRTMESTAYSWSEAGASPFAANGLDLRTNPMVVAVDPSVIPLGSIVEVQGYGVAVAADTGGAIKGNIVDVHFPTVAQCERWGRRNVQVRVM